MKEFTFNTTIDELDLLVTYEYTEFEPMTMYSPGEPENAEITTIELAETELELPDILVTDELIDLLQERALRHHNEVYR